ncbi:MAG: aspartyl protease family protein, partial [Nitrososphaerales archaeon]
MKQLKALIAENAEELLADVVLAAPGVNRGQQNSNKSSNNKNNQKKSGAPGTSAGSKPSGGGNKGSSNPSQTRPTSDGSPRSNTVKTDPKLEGACIWCGQRGHSPHGCANLKGIPVLERWEKIRNRWKTQTTCVRCLQDGHSSPGCPAQKVCGVAGCGKAHATPLHIADEAAVNANVAMYYDDIALPSAISSSALRGTVGPRGGFLPSLLCNISGTTADGTVNVVKDVRAVFDSGSSASFLKESIAERLGVEAVDGGTRLLSGIAGKCSRTRLTLVQCKLSAKISSFSLPCTLRTLPVICGALPPVAFSWDDIPEVQQELTTELLPRTEAADVDLLLGNDLLPELIDQVVSTGYEIRTMLWISRLGVAIAGGVQCNHLFNVTPCNYTDHVAHGEELACTTPGHVTNELLYAQLKQFWDWQSLGVLPSQEVVLSPKEKFVVQHFHDNVTFVDGHYQIRLPFDSEKPLPSNNADLALAQFRSLERGLLRNKERAESYSKAMQLYFDLGFAEVVQGENPEAGEAYFLPHHAVFKTANGAVPRIVFNAAAKDAHGVSLNDALLAGPKLQVDLVDILVRYRTFEYPMTADTAKMFNQIRLHPEDRRWVRFWWRNPGSTQPPQVCCKKVLTFGLNFAPYGALQTVMYHLDRHAVDFPAATTALRSSTFVDDTLCGHNNIRGAIRLRKEMQEVMELGGFHLTKWCATSSQILLSIPEADRAKSAPFVIAEKDLTLSQEALQMCLGLRWCPISDMFQFSGALKLMEPIQVETMRTLSSRASRMFDPCGYLTPVILIAKNLMQSAHRLQLGWDQPLPDVLRGPWLDWIQDLKYLANFEIDRRLYIQDKISVTLQGFCDASALAAAAVIYARSVDAQGRVQVTLVVAKSKLAPLNTISIPKLELLGALLLAKLMFKTAKALSIPISDVLCHTDNCSVIQWLRKSPSSWTSFVGNRTTQILELLPADKWVFVNTVENIADIASRGMSAPQLVNCRDWVQGPAFLWEDMAYWP